MNWRYKKPFPRWLTPACMAGALTLGGLLAFSLAEKQDHIVINSALVVVGRSQ